MSDDYDLLEEVSEELSAMEDQIRGYYDDVTDPGLRALLDTAAEAVREAWKEAYRLND